ncbi:hypothetical protein GOV06_01475 [Candidatus Woesearchaeota archaeon]|nr:hypothetical protein [Candidatus Woesearchaeota archaeon]
MAKQEPLEEQLRKIKPLDSSASKEPADLDKIISVYESVLADKKSYPSGHSYDKANFLKVSKEDIYEFVSFLPEYEKSPRFFLLTGEFLSGLINNLEESDDVVLDLTGLTKLNCLGHKLSSRTLLVKGDVRDMLGKYMKSGLIIVEGNAESFVGLSMRAGKIIVKGHANNYVGNGMFSGKVIIKGRAGDYVGSYMKNGEINIRCNTGKSVGKDMTGGVIHLNGNYESLSKKIKGGEIYHKGNRIYP